MCVQGDLARTAQTAGDVLYDDFVVAKSNKLKHDRGKDNSDIMDYNGMRESLLLTQDDIIGTTLAGSTGGALTLSITQPYGACRGRFLPLRTPAESQQRFNSVPWRKDVKS